MRLFAVILMGLCVSFHSLASTDSDNTDIAAISQLEREADLGDVQAQQTLVEHYLQNPSLIRDIEWYQQLVMANAFHGHLESQLALADMLERYSANDAELIDLTIAAYSAIQQQSPFAHDRTSELLAQKFNLAKKAQLNTQPLETLPISIEKDTSELDDHHFSPVSLSIILVLCFGVVGSALSAFRSKKALSLVNLDGLNRQVAEHQLTIDRQKQQLIKAQRLLSKSPQMSSQLNRSTKPSHATKNTLSANEKALMQACRVFGYQPDQIPAQNEIKRQYKTLSHRFHPDRHGDSDKMKTLNRAFSILIKNQTITL
ncbi:DnaJ domain-containing protein [Vibrio astriarenae]